jgi:hypothetical protein
MKDAVLGTALAEVSRIADDLPARQGSKLAVDGFKVGNGRRAVVHQPDVDATRVVPPLRLQRGAAGVKDPRILVVARDDDVHRRSSATFTEVL